MKSFEDIEKQMQAMLDAVTCYKETGSRKALDIALKNAMRTAVGLRKLVPCGDMEATNAEDMESVCDGWPATVMLTDGGTVIITFPRLLPSLNRRSGTEKAWMKAVLASPLREFAGSHDVFFTGKRTVVFEHVYSNGKRAHFDHDNFSRKHALDVIYPFFMPDDGVNVTYAVTSKAGDGDYTNVYIFGGDICGNLLEEGKGRKS